MLQQLDLVPIQSGVYFNLYEENAEFFKETWDFRTYNQTQLYIQAGFPLARSDFYSNYFFLHGIGAYTFADSKGQFL